MALRALDRFDRYMISNQLRLMEVLIPADASEISAQREIFEKGYELLYEEGMQHIYPDGDTLTSEDCLEVWNTMDMFDGIDRSLSALKEGDLEVGFFTKFLGYDGNSEGGFMAFAEFTVERLGRFTYLKLEKPDYWNSHMVIRPTYLRMLEVWQNLEVKDRFNMSRDQLLSVLRACIHPDNR